VTSPRRRHLFGAACARPDIPCDAAPRAGHRARREPRETRAEPGAAPGRRAALL